MARYIDLDALEANIKDMESDCMSGLLHAPSEFLEGQIQGYNDVLNTITGKMDFVNTAIPGDCWHDVLDEDPEFDKPLLLQMNGDFKDARYKVKVGFFRKCGRDLMYSEYVTDTGMSKSFIKSWAYLSDILPKNE